ncbi:Arabinose 5-phosphate isomerase KdsD [bacterium HR39]|nr:Arabinose 5-phosphate isomerase KdsD [bacterium HR39]
MQRRIVPHIVSGPREVARIGPSAAVSEAARRMRERHVAALLVMEDGRLVGIVTERDIVYRVVAEERDARAVTVREIMTPDPVTARPDERAIDALDKMRAGHFRHLPVVGEDGRVIAVVSIRDLHEAVRESLEEELHEAESYIHGEPYGLAG